MFGVLKWLGNYLIFYPVAAVGGILLWMDRREQTRRAKISVRNSIKNYYYKTNNQEIADELDEWVQSGRPEDIPLSVRPDFTQFITDGCDSQDQCVEILCRAVKEFI